MRIGIVTYDYSPAIGGLGESVKILVRALQAKFPDDEIMLISPAKEKGCVAPGVARFFWRRKGGCPLFSLSLLFSLARIVRKNRIDILHVHAGSGGVWLLKKPHIPVVVTSHHTYVQEAELVFGNSCISSMWKRMMACLEKKTYAVADKIMCVSADTRRVLISRYEVPAYKVSVVENSVDDEIFVPKKDIIKDGNTVTYLGRIEERKGIWILLRAFAKLKKKFPTLKLRLVGRNLTGRQLHRCIAALGLDGCVTVLGHVNQPHFVQEMQSATVVVIPSIIEGFGLVAAESMACGTCVIASASDGLKHVVSHRKTGLLFKPGDSDSCAAMVEEALAMPDARSMWEQAAKEEVKARFTPHIQAENVHACYRQINKLCVRCEENSHVCEVIFTGKQYK